MKEFWDSKYSNKEYVYGIVPNQFFSNELLKIKPGKILLPAEGEGRNAVFAAQKAWQVKAFDQSYQGKMKAFELANQKKVSVNFELADIEEYDDDPSSYDCLALIYVHFDKKKRQSNHRKLINYLKPGGTLILEGFSKDQINYDSGGPKNVDMLFSKEELLNDFKELTSIEFVETEILLNEGNLHKGKAKVVRLIGIK